MRFRALLLFALTLLIMAFLPALTASATPNRYPVQAAENEDACLDTALVKEVRADFKAFSEDFGKISSASTPQLYAILMRITDFRQKYEDMEAPDDMNCYLLINQTIAYWATTSDFALINLGGKLGATNQTEMNQNLDKYEKRIEVISDNLGTLQGALAGAQ